MSALNAILLGLIQGIAEFLPISSSGHLSVVQNVLAELGVIQFQGAEEGHLFFDVLLHLGTLASVCAFFWKDIKNIVLEFVAIIRDLIGSITGKRGKAERAEANSAPKTPARRMLIMLIIGTLPLLVVLPFKSRIEELYYNTLFIGIAFLLTGAMLFVSDKLTPGTRNFRTMKSTNALVIGITQAIAVIPGLSRSGTTITAGLANGLDRDTAVRYSFIMSLPAVLGATLLELIDAFKEGPQWGLFPVYLLGMAIAAVVGYFAIGLVRMIVNKGKFGYFAYYCLAIGVLTIIVSFII